MLNDPRILYQHPPDTTKPFFMTCAVAYRNSTSSEAPQILAENQDSQGKQDTSNATTKDNGYSPTAETMAKLPGVETAEDHQRILGPLSNLVFPFFDVIFPQALLDGTLEKVKKD